MAWERRRSDRYFYLSVRRGDRITKRYLGRGQVAYLTETHLELERKQRATTRDQLRQLKQRLSRHDDLLDRLNELCRLLLVLYRVERNWRIRRNPTEKERSMNTNSNAIGEQPVVSQLRELLERASAGDQAASASARALLADTPDLWLHLGDISRHAVTTWIAVVAGSDEFLRDAIRRKMDDLIQSLQHETSNPLEALLVQRVAATWVQLQHADLLVARATETAQTCLLKRQQVAQKQHLAAARGLDALQRGHRRHS